MRAQASMHTRKYDGRSAYGRRRYGRSGDNVLPVDLVQRYGRIIDRKVGERAPASNNEERGRVLVRKRG